MVWASKDPKLKVEHVRAHGGNVVRLSGIIDSGFDDEKFAQALDGVALIDLDEVRGITSSGVRDWLAAFSRGRPEYLGFVNCRPAMVSQFNIVHNFAGPGQLVSLYVPYSC